MKKLIINENMLSGLLMEMVKEQQLLNEISTVDAYNRFYKDKIPQDIYSNLMNGADKMDPFHKMCLDAYLEDNKDGEFLAKKIGDAWARSGRDARQLIIRIAESYWDEYVSLARLAAMAERVSYKKSHTERGYQEQGYHVLFENEGLLVTCTTSYAASTKYYGDSHWCTASDIFGNYNGFEKFKEYTVEDDCILMQMVDKQNRENSYQFIFDTYEGIIDSICDFQDKRCETTQLIKLATENGTSLTNIIDIISKSADELMTETRDLTDEEDDYWSQKIDSYIKKQMLSIKQSVKNHVYDNDLIEFLKKLVNDYTGYDMYNSMHDDEFKFEIIVARQDINSSMFVFEVSYYGGSEYYNFVRELEESWEQSLHPTEILLAEKLDNGDIKIMSRIPNLFFYRKFHGFFVLASYFMQPGQKYIGYKWGETKPFIESEWFNDVGHYGLFMPKGIALAGFINNDGKPGYAVNANTGNIEFEFLDYSPGDWTIKDTSGKTHQLKGNPIRLTLKK